MSETPAFHNPATRKLRLQPLGPESIPAHDSLVDVQGAASPPPLVDFVVEVLNETISFTDLIMHNQFRAKGKPSTSSPSTAPVQLLTFDVLETADHKPEAWFGRRSIHEDQAKEGTASWTEFEQGLFDNHSVNEGKYTPDVFDTRHILNYGESEGLNSEARATLKSKGWEDVAVEMFEMGHQIPGPLDNRVFSVLIVRGKVSSEKPPIDGVKDANGFATAQIPIDLTGAKASFYTSRRNLTEGDNARQKSKTVIGKYVSVERCRKQNDGQVAWEMATASDAGGILPMAIQKLGVPGAVIKDVGLFMKWVAQERKS